MPHFCAAVNCGSTSTRNRDLSFFRFPTDVERCKKWVINTRRADLDSKALEELHKSHVLCSTHFEDNQFANVLHNRLNWNAVPTLFDYSDPPAKLCCTRKLSLKCKETASASHATQDVTSKDMSSFGLSVKTEQDDAASTTTDTGSNIGEEIPALLNVDQQPLLLIAIGPHNSPVKTQKTECETTTVAASSGVEVNASLLNINQQLPLRIAMRAPHTSRLKIIQCEPMFCQLQSQSRNMDGKKVLFNTAVMETLPTEAIRPVQIIFAAPSTFKAMPDLNVSPRDLPCRIYEPQGTTSMTTTHTGTVAAEVTATVPNINQRLSVSRTKRPPDTPVEKQLKQKIRQLQSQIWKKNRKIKALKSKLAETQPQSTKQSAEDILEAASHFLTPLQLSLFRAQFLSSHKEKNGYRWSLNDKIFGLQLLYKSAEAFRFASQHLALPSVATLRRFVAETLGKKDSGFTTEPNLTTEALDTDDQHPE